MAEVLQFTTNSGKRRRITFEDFQKSLASKGVRERCANIFEKYEAGGLILAGKLDVALTHIETGSGLPERNKFGLCKAFTITTGEVKGHVVKKHLTTFFNEEFPNYLYGQTDLDKTDATELTATYTLAINGLLSDNAIYLRKKRLILNRLRNTRDQNIWEGEVLKSPFMEVVGPAAAGFVALEGTEFANEGIDFTDPYPYPSHVAALADPLQIMQFKELVQNTIKF